MTKPIPDFANEDEEREFWDIHDSTEYVDWSKAERSSATPTPEPDTPDPPVLLTLNELRAREQAAYERGKAEGAETEHARYLRLYADLAAAMGHMKGCGHPYAYLLKRYPELDKQEPTQ